MATNRPNKDTGKKKVKKSNPGRGLTIAVLVFACLLIGSIILIFIVSKRITSMEGADSQIKLAAQGGFNCEYSEAQKLYPYGEGVVKVTNERVAYLTLSGTEIYNVQVSYSNPQCVIYGDYVAVFDLNGYSFTLMTREKALYTAHTTNQIKALTISPKGYIAIITGSDESNGDVVLYDENGKAQYQWSSYNSGFPVSCCFDSESTKLAVSTVNTSGAVIVPYVRVFAISRGNSSLEMADSAMYTVEGNVLFMSMFYSGDKLYCFTSNSMYEVKEGKLVQINYDFSAIGYVNLVDNRLFITYSDGVSQLGKLAVLNGSESVIYNSEIGTKISAVAVSGKLYAISVDRRIFVFDSSGAILNDFAVDEDIIRLNFIAGNKLCVVSASGVHTVT
jgi:hypothetical protein